MSKRFLFFFCFGLALSLAQCVEMETAGRVVGIADGDTFTMIDHHNKQVRVRLYGIDAPEKNQDFGKVSKKFLSDLIFNKAVEIQEVDTDRYGRIIAIVRIDSLIVNEALLQAGLAWHYREYDDNPYWTLLQMKAQAERKGVWSMDDPIAPWLFRRHKRNNKAQKSLASFFQIFQ
jgi:micrococcal nuclease